jgi:hypothetical protein
LRNFETYTWIVFAAVAGECSPHSSSIKPSLGTTSPACKTRIAMTARCL